MQIAIISDVHGNLTALEAVLADIAVRGADIIVNLGDILSGPLYPAETADRLMPLNLPTIRGNHERQLLSQHTAQMGLSDRYTDSLLMPRHRDWIASLPESLWLTDDVLMVHGAPDSDLVYFLETLDIDGLRQATPQEIEERAGSVVAPVILCGHTHVPRIHRRLGGGLIINPGSVGLPAYADDYPVPHKVETGSPHARYALLRQEDRQWCAELVAITYDWESVAQTADANGRPDWGRALRTGFV